MSRIAVPATVSSSYPLDRRRILVRGDQVEHRVLDRSVQGVHVAGRGHLADHAADRQPRVEAVEHAWIDVGRAAYRRRVAEVAGDLLDGADLRAVAGGPGTGGRLARDR